MKDGNLVCLVATNRIHFGLSTRRFVPEICGVELGSREKFVGQKFQLRLGVNFWGDEFFLFFYSG